jgi:ABC-2 type transport system ATP-binding protein
MTPVITIRKLTKTFGNKEVIKNCEFDVNQGEIYGFLGANGAGKTTVLKLILGLLKPTMGRIEAFGEDAAKNRKAVLGKIGSIIETPIFYEHLSATENLKIHLAYLGLDEATGIEELIEESIEETLARVGLPNTGGQAVSTFSLGMRQRLGVARAIIHKPKILLLDEPINGLDPAGIRDMRELFRSLAEKDGVTIIISSHILCEIEHIADRIGVIANGAMIREVSMPELKAEHPEGLENYLIELMSGRLAQ